MAQPGSISVTWENALPASSNQNECSIATPRSNSGRAAALQETGKCTVPSCSGLPTGCCCPSCAEAAEARQRVIKAQGRVRTNLIETFFSPACFGKAAPSLSRQLLEQSLSLL